MSESESFTPIIFHFYYQSRSKNYMKKSLIKEAKFATFWLWILFSLLFPFPNVYDDALLQILYIAGLERRKNNTNWIRKFFPRVISIFFVTHSRDENMMKSNLVLLVCKKDLIKLRKKVHLVIWKERKKCWENMLKRRVVSRIDKKLPYFCVHWIIFLEQERFVMKTQFDMKEMN